MIGYPADKDENLPATGLYKEIDAIDGRVKKLEENGSTGTGSGLTAE